MFATWILCLFLVLIAPYLLIEASVLRTRKCAQLGAPRGYRSELARSSQTAWDYAQKLCGVRYMVSGIVMALAAPALLFAAPIDTIGSLYMFSVPRGYLDGFVSWCKQIIGLCLTAFLQSTILIAGLMVLKDHVLLGLGLMLAAGVIGGALLLFALADRTARRADIWLSGAIIGATVIAAWYVSGHVGHVAEHPETLDEL